MGDDSYFLSFCAPILEHFAGSILEENVERSCEHVSENTGGELADFLGRSSENVETDLAKTESTDYVYEEYTSSRRFNMTFSWKQNRPSVLMSLVDSILTVSGVLLVGGIFVGGTSATFLLLTMNLSDLCDWKDDRDKTLPTRVENIRFAAFVVGLPFIHSYQATIYVILFKWPLVKEHNLLLFSFLASFLDLIYRLLLKVFDIYTYKSFELPYPLNILTFVLCIWSGYLVSRTKFPNNRAMALRLSFRLTLQFVLGFPIMYFVLYVICPWYNDMPPHIIGRFGVIGTTGVIFLLSKTITRINVCSMKGVVLPENAYILVSFLYGSSAIVLRIMQAELEELSLFCIMGVAHGIVFLLERTSAPIIDLLVLRIYNSCFRRFHIDIRMKHEYKTRRSQRFTADASIQTMIYESNGLVISLAALFFYKLLYARVSSTHKKFLVVAFLKRILFGLIIEWFFNIMVVFVQTRFMNIAIFSVWKKKWRRHFLVAVITSVMTLCCFTVYLLRIVRSQFHQQPQEWMYFSENCTELPFSFMY